MNYLSLKTICLILFTGLFASAQQTQSLSLSEAIKTGLANSKNLKTTKAKVDAANAKYQEAVDATIPSVKVLASYSRYSDVPSFQAQFPGQSEPTTFYPNVPDNFLFRASLSEVIFSGFRLKYAKESQELLKEAVSLDAQKDSDEVVYNIVSAYYNLYKIKKSQEIMEDNLAQVKQHLKETVDRENQGIVTHNEVLRWELEQSNTELAQLDLDKNYNIANFNMDIMLGFKEDTRIVIVVDSSSVFPARDEKSLPEYMQMALINRGDLLSLDARFKSTENSLKITENSYYPNVAIGVNAYDARPNQRIFPLQDAFNDGWDAGITLTWDITNLYSNRHYIAETRATLTQTEVQKNLLADDIRMQVNQDYLVYRQAKKKLDVMQKAIVTADENYRIINNKYNNQLALQSELVDAYNTLMQAKFNLLLSKADAEVVYYKLLKSTGTIN